MYDRSDPRAGLMAASAPKIQAPETFAPPEYGRFYQEAARRDEAGANWYLRGKNFVLAYTEAVAGADLARSGQVDEYVLLIPDAATTVQVHANGQSRDVSGPSIVMVPPGESRILTATGGRLVRLFSSRSADMLALCPNAASYETPRTNIPPFEPWPEPADGYRIRAYSLDVPPTPGRFGRIFRCTTFMVNILDPQMGPRDITKLSPHHHDDFEQCSLSLEGAFIHHLRWPWTVNLNAWREDEHQHFASPSALVIPPPCIHTSRGIEPGLNQLVDIFSPPRIDFSRQNGWVLNADDYPMPSEG